MNAPEDVTNSSPGDVRQMFEIRNADGELLPPERLPGRRALAGEENPQELVRYVWRSTGEERWSMVKASAVKDANGAPILAISVMEDLTEHMRSEAAQRFLSTASKALGESLDYEKTLAAVADAAVPSLGDWCLVEILDKHNELTLVALAHSDGENPTAAEAIRELYESRMEAEVGPANVIRTGEAEFYPEITPELLDRATDNPVRRQLVESLGIRSGIAAPITGRGRTIGVFTLISASSRRLYTETDLATALELGRRAGSAIENARLHTDRTRMLRTMQRSLIPPRLPEMPGVDLAAHFRPAEIDPEVGGDFYDVFQMPDGSWALVIGDVCGKGPDAAAVTALARYTIRTAAMRDTEPEGILSTLNGALIEQAEDDRFCTVAFAKLHPGNGSCGLEIVSAGHPLPVKITGDVSQALGTPGTLLGVVPTPDLPRVEAHLDPGDLLMLYTDGLSAGLHPDDTEYAVEITTGLRPKSAQDAVDRIDAAAAQSREGPRRDDIAIVVASKH
jgi:serine phosphatase RsbU (regulator of sigma subunit)